MTLENKINEIKSQFDSDLCLLDEKKVDHNSIHYKYLGIKGLLSRLYPQLSKADKSDKPRLGNQINL